MNIHFFLACCLAFLATSCATPIPKQGDLGFCDKRSVVIIGENVEDSIAQYYQKKYSALVWFTPRHNELTHVADNVIESGIGPSRPLRALIVQLESINQSVGRWDIYIPKIAEKYFIRTLKHMKDGSLSKARGSVILIDSTHAPELEKEVARVTSGNFFVEFENGQDTK